MYIDIKKGYRYTVCVFTKIARVHISGAGMCRPNVITYD